MNQTFMIGRTSVASLSFSSLRRPVSSRRGLSSARNAFAAITLLLGASTALAQSPTESTQEPAKAPAPQTDSTSNQQPQSSSAATSTDSSSLASSEAKQTKRILWIYPNYRAVSADTQLPPLSLKTKFWLATEDSFDYSSFISAGMIAGISQANRSYPEFGQGAKGFGRYYWHAVADQAVGNYFTEAIVPAATHQDPRYYTLGHGGIFKRTGYAISRLLITRTDSGGRTANVSEIVGNGAGAGISDLYYPSRERTWTKTGQKWLTQCALDGLFNIAKEFWPDVNRIVFHSKY